MSCMIKCIICKTVFLGYKPSKFCKKEKCQGIKKQKNRDTKSKWQKNNPEKVKEKAKLWKKNNPEKVKEQAKLWLKNNPERNKEQQALIRMFGTSKVSLEVKQMTALQQNCRKGFTEKIIKQIEKGNTHEAYI